MIALLENAPRGGCLVGSQGGMAVSTAPRKRLEDGPSVTGSLALRLGLSVFLLYHLAVILIMPISSSLIGRQVAGLFLGYANQLGFNTTWQFFSPGPAPVYFLEYQLETVESMNWTVEEYVPPETLQYPPQRDRLTWSDSYNRRLYGMRFLTLFPDRLEGFFIPFLCRQHPEAVAISLQSVIERVPDVERSGEWASFEEMSERFALPRQRYECVRDRGRPGELDSSEGAS